MKKTLSFMLLFIAASSFAQMASTTVLPDNQLSKEWQTPVGKFALQSLIPISQGEQQYTMKTFTTTDGGSATFYVNKEIEESNIAPSAVNHSDVNIYPNPFSGSATITIAESIVIGEGGLSLTIYDMLGKEVQKSKIFTHQASIERGTLTDGIYLYKVADDNGVIETGKINIQ
jgi:hypothetical protein